MLQRYNVYKITFGCSITSLSYSSCRFEFPEIATIVLVTGFTCAWSTIRPAVLPLVLVVSVYTIPRYFDQLQRTIVIGVLGGSNTANVLQYIELALLGRYAVESGGQMDSDRNLRRVNQGQANHAARTKATAYGNPVTV